MKRYKVTWEFLNSRGEWVPDDLTNNGEGFTIDEAEAVAYQVGTNLEGYAMNICVVEVTQ